MIACEVNDLLKMIGRDKPSARIKKQALLLTFILLVIACALPAKAMSFISAGKAKITLTAGITGSVSFTMPYPPGGGEPSSPTISTGSRGTQLSPYPGPGDIQGSSSTPTQGITVGIAYPTPGNPVFLTPTPTSNLTYPGQGTAEFTPPQATFLFPTPQFGTPASPPTVTPPIAMEMNTAIPPPAWINSELRASDLSGVNLISGKNQLFFFFAFWDGASLAMAPLVHAVEEDYQERINFVYLDIDDPAADYYKKELGYDSQPHFFLIDPQGVIIQQWIGYVRVEELIQAIDSALQ
jgi:thiol-disulfide isomerase/thioredoxin